MRPRITILLGAAALAALWAGACSRSEPPGGDAPPATLAPVADPTLLTVERPERFALVAAAARDVRDAVQANGVVAADVSKTVPVTSLAGGRVVQLYARLGDDVQKGQLLLRITSSDLAAAYADYQKAVADEVLARETLDRARDLFDHGAAPKKDLEGAEDAARKAGVDVQTAADHIRILGGDVAHPTDVVEVRAPISGTIIDQQVQPSGAVKSLDNEPNLFTIADLSQVWILSDVFENDLAHVEVGDVAHVRLAAYPDKTFEARVSNISKVLDKDTRTAKVRLELGNAEGLLKPGMFATATFFSQAATPRVVVPASAILRLHDKDWVFRAESGDRFRRVEIQAGPAAAAGEQIVLSGLQPGDQVVEAALQFSSTVAQ